jgi:hypothetical protein
MEKKKKNLIPGPPGMFQSHTRSTLVKARFPKFFFSPKIRKISKDLPRKKEKRKSLGLSIEVSKVATRLWPKLTPCRQPPHSWAHNLSAKKAQSALC